MSVEPDTASDAEASPPTPLGEGQVIVLAAVAWVAARLAVPIPAAPAAVACLAAMAARRPVLFIVGTGLLATSLGHRAELGFRPVAEGIADGEVVTVVDDPRPVGVGWRATVRMGDGRRVEAVAHGRAGFTLGRLTAGDRVALSGRVTGVEDSSWARSRHLLGRLTVTDATRPRSPTGARAVVERLRSFVVAGSDPLPERARPLYLGLVIGEDRFQPPAQRARFAAAGLAHLLAVSGQNVAFVLTVLRPLIRLAGPRLRFVSTAAVLAVFAVATRLEPSVLRATVTAGLAAWAAIGGHRQSGVRLLGLAVTALVLIDPFLVHSVGFQLSVAASAGILVIAPLLAGRLGGPRFLVEPLAVTVAAQAAVVPLLAHTFGPVSVASVPANLAAGWAAGVVMTWGLTVGVVAGLVDPAIGHWLQLPALAAVRWLDAVAAWAARVPAPTVGARSLVAGAGGAGAAWLLAAASSSAGASPWARAVRRALGGAVAGIVAAGAVATVPQPPRQVTELDGGGWWIPHGPGRPSVLVVTAEADEDLLDAVIANRLVSVDVVIAESGGGRAAPVVASVMELVTTGTVYAPPRHRIVGARRVTAPFSLPTAGPTVVVSPDRNRLIVVASPAPGEAVGQGDRGG